MESIIYLNIERFVMNRNCDSNIILGLIIKERCDLDPYKKRNLFILDIHIKLNAMHDLIKG